MKLLIFFLLPHIALAECNFSLSPNDTVYIGDSISVSTYGDSLSQELEEPTTNVARFAVAGSAALHWGKGFKAEFFTHKNALCISSAGSYRNIVANTVPTLTGLFQKAEPKALVIALGTNDMNNFCTDQMNNSQAGAIWLQGIQEMVAALPANSKCVWISPWNYSFGTIAENCRSQKHGVREVLSKIETLVSERCVFLRSEEEWQACGGGEISFDRQGIHPVGESARQLGSCLGKAAQKYL